MTYDTQCQLNAKKKERSVSTMTSECQVYAPQFCCWCVVWRSDVCLFFLHQDHPDGGVYVKDLTIMIVKGVRDLQQVMEVPKSDMVLNT